MRLRTDWRSAAIRQGQILIVNSDICSHFAAFYAGINVGKLKYLSLYSCNYAQILKVTHVNIICVLTNS